MTLISADKRDWFVNRLKCMSIEEMAHRAAKQLGYWNESRRLKRGNRSAVPPPDVVSTIGWIAYPQDLQQVDAYLEGATTKLCGHIDVFQHKVESQWVVQNWNSDPKTGTRAPMVYGKTLDYRNETLVGDIKYLWEPNRHLHVVNLAQAYCLSKQVVYLKGVHLHLRSWINQCPYLLGPNWSSSLEVAIRLINWSIVWQLIGGCSSELFSGVEGISFRKQWLSSIFQHMQFLSSNLSRYSSANNHLIGEVAGLYIGCNTWPFWGKMTDQWRNSSRAALIKEAAKQTFPDGVGREQAISYQQFVLDFLILSLMSGEASGDKFPDKYRKVLEKMMDFIAALIDCRGNMPMIGDADDGYVVQLSQEKDFCPYRSLLATGAVLFQRADFFRIAGKIDDKTRWLTGGAARFTPTLPDNEFKRKRDFPHGGYYILGSNLGTDEEIRCIVDCGPLGYLSIAAHGHADALSLYLSLCGKEFLIDPGTYSYHTKKVWRDYFKGTSAHNTVRIDGCDQSVNAGNFMWAEKAAAETIRFESTREFDSFEGRHDGYKRLRDPVIHKRKVILLKSERILRVIDTIQCTQRHCVERFWHFGEKCDVKFDGESLCAENQGSKIEIRAIEGAQIVLKKGDDAPPSGWVSRHYDLKVPGYTAIMMNKIVNTMVLQTEIKMTMR